MKKIVLSVGLAMCLVYFLLSNVPAHSGDTNLSEVNAKLDKVLANQALMLDYLKFIKNRSR